jgi:hypothetical protein
MITGITGTYRRRPEEHPDHAEAMAEEITAYLVTTFGRGHHAEDDFYVEYNHGDPDGLLPDSGDPDPKGWLRLDVDSSGSELRDDAQTVANFYHALGKAAIGAKMPTFGDLPEKAMHDEIERCYRIYNEWAEKAAAIGAELAAQAEEVRNRVYEAVTYMLIDVDYDTGFNYGNPACARCDVRNAEEFGLCSECYAELSDSERFALLMDSEFSGCTTSEAVQAAASRIMADVQWHIDNDDETTASIANRTRELSERVAELNAKLTP